MRKFFIYAWPVVALPLAAVAGWFAALVLWQLIMVDIYGTIIHSL